MAAALDRLARDRPARPCAGTRRGVADGGLRRHQPAAGRARGRGDYGPQKGADEAQVRELDAALAHYADVLEAACGRTVRDVPGAGAAGGTTAGLLAIADRFASFDVRPGVEVVMELTGFDEALASCDLVLTGEGRIDAQTAFGKTAQGVAERAAIAGSACICFGGGVTPEGIAALAEARRGRRAGHRAADDLSRRWPPVPRLRRAAERAARLARLLSDPGSTW